MKIKIDTFEISQKSNVFIIAELSANHNQNIEIAIETIRAAKRSGADAIKLQTYTPDTLTIDSDKSDFIIKGTIWNGKNYYSLYKEAFTPWEWHEKLFQVAKEEGLICFSSPFDKTAVDFLEKLNVPAYKIASFEITDIPLIEYVASKQKPMFLSTGMANIDEVSEAVNCIKKKGNHKILLFHCISNYPAELSDSQLGDINFLKEKYNISVGLSDHTKSNLAAILATALGASAIEKHFKLDDLECGPDSSFSIMPEQLRAARLYISFALSSDSHV